MKIQFNELSCLIGKTEAFSTVVTSPSQVSIVLGFLATSYRPVQRLSGNSDFSSHSVALLLLDS